MANSRQRKKATAKPVAEPESAPVPADVTHPAAPAVVAEPEQPRKRIRLITNPPTPAVAPSMMGRQIRPFAQPAQSGTFAPFAAPNARRGR